MSRRQASDGPSFLVREAAAGVVGRKQNRGWIRKQGINLGSAHYGKLGRDAGRWHWAVDRLAYAVTCLSLLQHSRGREPLTKHGQISDDSVPMEGLAPVSESTKYAGSARATVFGANQAGGSRCSFFLVGSQRAGCLQLCHRHSPEGPRCYKLGSCRGASQPRSVCGGGCAEIDAASSCVAAAMRMVAAIYRPFLLVAPDRHWIQHWLAAECIMRCTAVGPPNPSVSLRYGSRGFQHWQL